MIVRGDCVALMAELAEGSVDAIVTDPPYGLEFMGKKWDRLGDNGSLTHPGPRDRDGSTVFGRQRVAYNGSENTKCRRCGRWTYDHEGRKCECATPDVDRGRQPRLMQEWHEAWAREALRVLKPGGHLLAFGGTRTYHRLACAIEDAGFEIRDCLAWLYGSGFPKSLDVSKAIDKAAGAERTEVVGVSSVTGQRQSETWRDGSGLQGNVNEITAPATPEAAQWQGWGTALKPAHEPIVLARKPLSGTVAQTVLEHGTGALNVDECRIGTEERTNGAGSLGSNGIYGQMERNESEVLAVGRWPANVLLDEQAAAMLDEQTGELGQSTGTRQSVYGYGMEMPANGQQVGFGDSGGASRFLYVAKASSAERNAGLDGFEEKVAGGMSARADGSLDGHVSRQRNVHPTVKPIELMRWLVRLVTPPGGTVLDPFTGSGTTGCAAALEGFNFLGFEREAEYVKIAEARIAWWSQHPDGLEIVKALEADRERKAIRDSGQLDLLA